MLTYEKLHRQIFEITQGLESDDSYSRHHALRQLNLLEQTLESNVTQAPLETYNRGFETNMQILENLGKHGAYDSFTFSHSRGMQLELGTIDTHIIQTPLVSYQDPTALAIRSLEHRARIIMEYSNAKHNPIPH